MSDDRTLSTSRAIPYSRGEVFRAFSSSDLLSAWWGPEGFSSTFEIFEFREGGRWLFVMHGPDGASFKNDSYFEAIHPESKIVIRHDCPPHFTLTVELAAVEGGTEISWNQCFDEVDTAQAIRERVGRANEENIDRLERVLREAGQ